MNLKIITIIIISFLNTFFTSSCRKFVEIPIPHNEFYPSILFSDSVGASSAVTGIYIEMMQNFSMTIANGGLTLYTGLASDELFPTSFGNSTILQFYQNAIEKDNTINGSLLWSHGYKIIYHANMCIDHLETSNSISTNLKNKLIAEVKFVRAFTYFKLINLYGDVPLIQSTDYGINKELQRTDKTIILETITQDLIQSADNLPAQNFSRLRPSIYSAKALLSRIYLYQKKWDQAESEATIIINSGIISLEHDILKVFLAGSKETIWALDPVLPNFETLEGANFIPATPTRLPAYAISDYLLNSFENNDLRSSNGHWITKNTIAGNVYHYPTKYKQRRRMNPLPGDPVEHYVIFRLAEQYLIRAEARAYQSNLIEAVNDLNIIRSRAGLTDLPTSLDQNNVLNAIAQERKVELFCEWGHRWFDIKRMEKATDILSSIKQDWQGTDILFPIPQIEINRNPFLVQNPGY